MNNSLELEIQVGACGYCQAITVVITAPATKTTPKQVVAKFEGRADSRPQPVTTSGSKDGNGKPPLFPAPAALYRAFVRFMEQHRFRYQLVRVTGDLDATTQFLKMLEEARFTTVPVINEVLLDAERIRQLCDREILLTVAS